MSQIEASVSIQKLKTGARKFQNIFISSINSYRGRALLETLSNSEDINVDGHFYGTVIEYNINNNQTENFSPAHVLNPKSGNFVESVLKCDVIICDIGHDPAEVDVARKILNALESHYQNISAEAQLAHHYFILISTPLTWNRTNGVQSNQETYPTLREEDYRSRRTNEMYRPHKELERDVILAQKKINSFLQSVVLCPGITYGGSNDVFRYICKKAFCNTEVIRIYEPGNQVLPLLYLNDFCRIVKLLLKEFPPKMIRYIFAAQPQHYTLFEFAKIIVRGLADEPVRLLVSNTQAVQCTDSTIKMQTEDYLRLNMKLEGSYLKDFSFISFSNQSELETVITTEFLISMNISPFKIIIDGPPSVGKTTLAKSLADYYKGHYINHDNIKQTLVAKLQHTVKVVYEYLKILEENAGYVSEHNRDAYTEQASLIVEEMKNLITKLEKHLDDLESVEDENKNVIIKLLLQILSWKSCFQSQGYILDGFPYTYNEINQIFPTEIFQSTNCNAINIKPSHVIVLDADDDVLRTRAMSFTESEAIQNHCTEDEFYRRLKEYRARNEDDVSVTSFFIDNNLIPMSFKLMRKTIIHEALDFVKSRIGAPKVYSISCQSTKDHSDIEGKGSLVNHTVKIDTTKEKNLRQWTEQLEKLKSEQQDLLEAQTLPLRHYLMKHVLPTLTKGLLEIATVRPENPVEYLAEYLFRISRNGTSFDNVQNKQDISDTSNTSTSSSSQDNTNSMNAISIVKKLF